MHFVFEVCKLLFFVSALGIAFLKRKGSELMDAQQAATTLEVLLPGFFMLAGIMIGRIFAVFFSDGFRPSSQLLMKGFIIGLLLGIGANLLYRTMATG